MGWIRTYTGLNFDYNDIEHQEISIIDIAHALSNICRFSGHTKQFYSVAQHSVLVSQFVDSKKFCHEDRLRLKMYALMHDAAEAYIQDIPRPLKCDLPNYKNIEDRLERRIGEVFGTSSWLEEPYNSIIKEVDIRMCVSEAECLHQYDYTWGEKVEPYFTEMEVLSPERANLLFLEVFLSLKSEIEKCKV